MTSIIGTTLTILATLLIAAAVIKAAYTLGIEHGAKIEAKRTIEQQEALLIIRGACLRWLDGDLDQSSEEFIRTIHNYSTEWSKQ